MKLAVVIELPHRADLVVPGFRSHDDATSWAERVIGDRFRWWVAQQASAAEIAEALRTSTV
jgi:hypothetical protein